MRDTNPEVLVATPGRLIDMVNSYNLDLSEVDYFVLDEGDRMLEDGFGDQVKGIACAIRMGTNGLQ